MNRFLVTLICLFPFFLHASPPDTLDLQIPTVDMHDYKNPEKKAAFIDTLFEAMTTVGFFAVVNTGIDAESMKEAYRQTEVFFHQDMSFKMQCFDINVHGQRGFVPSEIAKGGKAKDHKEYCHIGREGGEPANIWPEQQPEFKIFLSEFYKELEKYMASLQEAIIDTINIKTTSNIPLNYLNASTVDALSLLRTLHYYPFTDEEINDPTNNLMWAAEHTDIDILTILPYATEKGLQVYKDVEWLNVVVPEDAFIINIGDMLENLTNGLFVSSRHRVMAAEPNKERFSMVFFVHPTDETPLDPLPACIAATGGTQRYAPGTRQEFLWERLLEIGIGPTLLLPYSQTGHVERQMKYGRASPQVIDLLIKHGLASPELLEAVKS